MMHDLLDAVRDLNHPAMRPPHIARLDFRNIGQDEAGCDRQPVVVGTRVRVATILVCYGEGMRVEGIVQQYPFLTPADVHDALTYAYDHLAEIEQGLAADDESAVKACYRGADVDA